MKLNDVVITIGEHEIKADSMEIETLPEEAKVNIEPIHVCYEGELSFGINDEVVSEYLTHGWIGTRDDRIKTNLGRIAKSVSIPADAYVNISHALDKIDRVGGRK